MDYQFIKCSNPRHITNRYTGQQVLVECGKCEACLLKKNLSRKSRCLLENSAHRYCYFVTLTYENKFLPQCTLAEKKKDENGGYLYSVFKNKINYSFYDKETNSYKYEARYHDGEYLGEVYFKSYADQVALMKKCNVTSNPNYFPILDYRDIQNFLKRLRKRIKNEKIRYFYCGELGPVHFRPHFHLLLWFEEEQTQQNLFENIRSSWPFGRVDVSLSKGKSISYVASYVNSHMYLPDLFRLQQTSPKSCHSWYLGDSVYTDEIKISEETDIKRLASHRIFRDGFNTDFILWRSLKTRLAPKCKGYNSKSEYERILSYSLNAKLREWTQETSPLYQARFIRDYVEFFDFYSPDDGFNEVLQYFRHGLNYYENDQNGIKRYLTPSLADYDKFERMVYKELLLSRSFLRDFCDGDDSYDSIVKHVRLIDKFYKELDYENLRKQLEIVQNFSKMPDNPSTQFFYHNSFDVDDLKKLPEFKRFTSSRKSMYSNYIKHKELNDKNKIFCYG